MGYFSKENILNNSTIPKEKLFYDFKTRNYIIYCYFSPIFKHNCIFINHGFFLGENILYDSTVSGKKLSYDFQTRNHIIYCRFSPVFKNNCIFMYHGLFFWENMLYNFIAPNFERNIQK